MSEEFMVSSSLKAFRTAFPVRQIEVEGAIWSFRDTDPGSDRMPIVMLPGAGGTGDVFYHAVADVHHSRRVITVAYPPIDNADQLAAELGRALDMLGVAEVDILGSSVGGYIAQAFTHEWPERVRLVMLCNTFFDAAWLRAKIAADAMRATPSDEHLANTRKQLQGLPEDSPAKADFKQTMLTLVGKEQTGEMAKAALLAALSAARIGAVPLSPEAIAVLDCDDDPVVDEPTRAALRQRYAESRQYHLPFGGHYPALLNPKAFSQAVCAHFAED